MQHDGPKIVCLDIETAPETVYTFKRFDTTIGQSQVVAGGYILCAAWSWLGEKKVHSIALPGHRNWNRGDRRNDRVIALKMHEILSEADIVIGHNVRAFDTGFLNARFAVHGLGAPAPYRIVDTLTTLRRHFKLPSRSLEAAAAYFGIKAKHKQQFSLWSGCMDGDPAAWAQMVSYCCDDVEVDKQLFEKIRPWIDGGANHGTYVTGTGHVCPKPGCGSPRVQRRGVTRTLVSTYPRYQCMDCGGWSRGKVALPQQRREQLTHIRVE